MKITFESDDPRHLEIVAGIVTGVTLQETANMDGACQWRDYDRKTLNLLGAAMQHFRLKPVPKIREWTRDEAPLGAHMRLKGSKHRCLLSEVRTFNSNPEKWDMIVGANPYDAATLLKDWEHSTDGGASWFPCGTEVA